MTNTPEFDRVIDRREAVKRVSALLGGAALIGGTSLLAHCSADRRRAYAGIGEFSTDDVALLDEIAETMLPETDTPGAKAAAVGPFMALMVTDTYTAADQAIFRDGLTRIKEASVAGADSVSFMNATPEQRLALLEQLDGEQKSYHDAKEEQERQAKALAREGRELASTQDVPKETPNHFFRMMKELALLGYFTSEIGYTKALRYSEAPGSFEPCVPYVAGDKAWAPHA